MMRIVARNAETFPWWRRRSAEYGVKPDGFLKFDVTGLRKSPFAFPTQHLVDDENLRNYRLRDHDHPRGEWYFHDY
jgi:hypothetical protein